VVSWIVFLRVKGRSANFTSRTDTKNIGLGDIVENLEIYPPIARETVTAEGVVLWESMKTARSWTVSSKRRNRGEGISLLHQLRFELQPISTELS
jgi:hypothetical protein